MTIDPADAGSDPSHEAVPDIDAAPVCPHEGPPVVDPTELRVCPACGGGRCVAERIVPEAFRARLGDCMPGQKCVPDGYLASGGNFIPPTCRSIANAEGRCLSRCLPEVAAQAGLLPQATCGEFEVCAPCFDPSTGVETGACGLSCDPGPQEPAATLQKCCDGEGSCVPAEAIPEANRGSLGIDVCPPDQGLLCAPDIFVVEGQSPATCSDLLGQEGRCLPGCIREVQDMGFLFGQATCEAGYKCVPCTLFFVIETGVCTL